MFWKQQTKLLAFHACRWKMNTQLHRSGPLFPLSCPLEVNRGGGFLEGYWCQLSIGNISLLHWEMSHQTQPLKSVIWALKHLPVLGHGDKTSTQQSPTPSLTAISTCSGWFGRIAHTTYLEKWAVWSSGLCFNLSQVRLGSLLTGVKTGTLYFMVICIYQFVVFCTVKNQKDLQTRSSQPDQGFVQFSSQHCL